MGKKLTTYTTKEKQIGGFTILMEMNEVKEILTVLKTSYPQSFTSYNSETGSMLLSLWYEGLKDYPTPLVTKAVQSFVFDDTREFAPNIGQVRRRILEISNPELGQAEYAFEQLRIACQQLYSETDVEDAKRVHATLPPMVQRMVSPSELITMAFHTTSQELMQYNKPRFIKDYNSMVEANIKTLQLTGGGHVALTAGNTED